MPEQTSLMDQYRRLKERNRDAVLFFRLGDFYEMFDSDAVEVSALLNLTLTKRQERPMCGIPYHASRSYVARLLRLGRKVAICEQVGDPASARGIMEREVVEVVTPGTTVEEDYLEARANNWLVAIGRSSSAGSALGLAYADVSTGEFRALSFPALDLPRLRRELYRLAPREALVQQSLLDDAELARAIGDREGIVINAYPDWSFDGRRAAEELKERFGVASLKGFGFEDEDPAVGAAGLLLSYVAETARHALPHLRSISRPDEGDRLLLDESTQRNLELDRGLQDGGRAYSLLGAVDATRSSMGSRLLRQWLLSPLRDPEAIGARHAAVDALYREQRTLERLRAELGRVLDLERLGARVALDKAHAKDLLALRDAIQAGLAAESACSALAGRAALLDFSIDDAERKGLSEVRELVESAIAEEPPVALHEGGLIKKGFDETIDRLRALRDDARTVLETYVEEERAATGIAALKLRYNRVLGWFLETTRASADRVPARFVRRQSMAGAERFSTERLAAIETELNSAAERLVELERARFLEIRERVKLALSAISSLAAAVARVDCLASFARVATERGWNRPVVDRSGVLRIVEGRHPVVEAHLPSGAFVPNGTELDAEGARFALITGPNMAGKSTYLRQTALIVILAQAGSFVPALEARIGVADRVFCRVGAQDNLARGESTFLVEMHETAHILREATARSLVVMDEVGRGTSTVDGLAIAWAASEYLLDASACRTLFATHYHELTALKRPGLVNLSMSVEERDGEVAFLRRVVPGPATGSYGVHVARLAGVPEPVLVRAREIQAELEKRERGLPDSVASRPRLAEQAQGALFANEELVLGELRALDPERMTPLEALNRLAALRKLL
ncbi:MAG: DNA mismatch repair protein MutS [Spirochaetales bacterium]|nr:DNA mismatch repair protein MutS [Spirochaetales bacterium]